MNSKLLLGRAGIECELNQDITKIVRYASQADENSLYVDVYRQDEFVVQALAQGAVVLSEKTIPGCLLVDNARRVLSELVQIFYDFPHQKMKMIGVTGTCGKSTVVHLIRNCLKNQNRECLCVMTGQVLVHDEVIHTRNTTPDALFLVPLMRKCLDEGIDTVVMEVSSEAFALWRTEGLYFDMLIGTTIASDHLDSHKTIESYREVKKKILSMSKPGGIVLLNSDDEWLKSWSTDLPGYVMTYGSHQADFMISDVELTLEGSSFTFLNHRVRTSLLSKVNVYNLTACLCCGFVLDLNMDQMLKWCKHAEGCKGRFEVVCKKPYVMIDYAHTQKAMEQVLNFLRTVSSKKIICVFGCGGNRDRIKRPLMGKTSTKFSDLVIVTSDNPRDEDPNKIIEEICTGCDKNVLVEPDRVKAIEMALTMSSKNDIIVLIGKGNEPSLFSEGKMISCTDHDVVLRYLKED